MDLIRLSSSSRSSLLALLWSLFPDGRNHPDAPATLWQSFRAIRIGAPFLLCQAGAESLLGVLEHELDACGAMDGPGDGDSYVSGLVEAYSFLMSEQVQESLLIAP